MLGQIPRPSPTSENELASETKEAFEVKLIKWHTITDSLQSAIRTTSTIDTMSHMGDMELASNMWKRFEYLYWDSGFIERNKIFMRLSTQTLSDFDDVAQFADTIKRNSIRLNEIDTTDVADWMYTT